MRKTPDGMEAIWRSGNYTGANRPFVRVTVQHPRMSLHTFPLRSTFRRITPKAGKETPSSNPYPQGIDPTKGEKITNTYADYIFAAPSPPMELPNVKSVSWTRSVDTDVAEATVEFWNTAPLPLGEEPVNDDLDLPGFYTAGRGSATFSGRWGHKRNQWSEALVPDNILRTYEGYGTDTELGRLIGEGGYVVPEKDSRLLLTGVWMIDEVKLSASGTLVCTCRDLGRLLMDHLSFPPVIPEDFYPVNFRDWSDKVVVAHKWSSHKRDLGPIPFKVVGSGNDKWPESAYIGAKVYGHTHTHADDGNADTYWLSVGNPNPAYRSAFEYIDIRVNKAQPTKVLLHTVKTGYTVFVSLKRGDTWAEGKTMPYHRDGRGRYEEGVPYVARGSVKDGRATVNIPEGHKDITLIRVWLGNLPDFGLPGVSKWRAAIREVKVEGITETRKKGIKNKPTKLKPGPAGSNPGRVQDYTDIIKLSCAWAGLYWPSNAKLLACDGTARMVGPVEPDSKVLGSKVKGRVWGDFMQTGVAPPVEIESSNFDKKSLMDAITYIRDIIGFLFQIDEQGAVVWRLQNIWTLGNWAVMGYALPGRTQTMLSIDERQVVMGLEATINSRSVREGVFVANPTGAFAAIAAGYNPNDTGLRRFGGWTDQNFASIEEAKVMADLITVRQLFQYRRDTVEIPAHPGIQVDDQVRIFERVTSEGFVHYVMGISSTNDMSTGQWTYNLQTHWLGEDPEKRWIFDRSQLSEATIDFLDDLINGSVQFVSGKSTI